MMSSVAHMENEPNELMSHRQFIIEFSRTCTHRIWKHLRKDRGGVLVWLSKER